MIVWLAGLASAAAPTWEAAGWGELGQTTSRGLAGGGGGLASVGFGPERWQVELGVSAATGATSRLRPQVRLWLSDPYRPAASVVLGGGVAFDTDPYAHLAVGLGFDPGRGEAVRARLTGWFLPRLTPTPAPAAGLSLGIAWHRRRPPPVAQAPRLQGSLVWVPGPVCEWLPPDAAARAWVDAGIAEAPTHTVGAPAAEDRAPERVRAPETGDLVVVASPADRLVLGREPLPLDEGHALVSLPEGERTLKVIGAGRATETPVVVTAGTTSWIRVPAPEPITVLFGVGSAALDASARALLEQVAANLGGWTLELAGGFSPEGDLESNRSLARRRAEEVRDFLIGQGVPSARLVLGESFEPSPEQPFEAQRVARIAPREGR